MNLQAKLIELDNEIARRYCSGICESEMRILEESLAVESYLQFAERMGLNVAKQALAHQLDQTREIAA